MGKLGFYFNMASCIGCRTCQIACKDKNDLDVGILFRRVRTYETGAYPAARVSHYSGTCNNCSDPACAASCPVGAMHVSEDGIVLHDDELCIGCKTCTGACPYGVPQYFPEHGKVTKCDFCADLRAVGKRPACVEACVMRILDFGDLDELRAKYGDALVSELPILPPAETGPSLLVATKGFMLEGEHVEIVD